MFSPECVYSIWVGDLTRVWKTTFLLLEWLQLHSIHTNKSTNPDCLRNLKESKQTTTHLFIAVARVVWVSYEMEPKLMAPKEKIIMTTIVQTTSS